MMKKTEKAREDKDRSAKPKTQLVVKYPPGKLNLPGNALDYEYLPTDLPGNPWPSPFDKE
jgi:hypothetical protein